MKDEPDKQVFKFKKDSKKRKEEKESNSSRDSLELTIRSYKNNNKITQKETEEGEKIKFFFNELPTNKNNRFATASNKKFQKANINFQKEREEFDFREILLNYVNQTGRTNENKSHKKERNSVIYTKPNVVLTLNGDSETNKNEFSNQISESSSEYISESKSLSNSSTDKKTEKIEDLHKKINEDKEHNNKNVQINNDKNINKNNNNKKEISKSNNAIKKYKNKIIKEKSNVKKGTKNIGILSGKKVINTERNNESVINSNYNKFTNSNKIKSSNTFTTGANTFNTQNTQNSSFKSLQLNIKKFNYDYLNLTEMSLQKKLIIQNIINSSKKMINKEEKEKEKGNIIIKNEGTNMFDKIRNLNITLEVERSYSNYFKQIINLQNQKNNYKNISSKKVKNSEKSKKSLSHHNFNKRYFYYPDEYYIDKNIDLHSKSHISKLFDKLRKKY